MPLSPTSTILDRFPKSIGLGLRPAYIDLLAKLGDPQKRLPPVFHVAGTNGKGSTCAFLRAMLEAAGYKVHVYTSPHLVRFHERIRIAGHLIEEDYFAELLTRCEQASTLGDITVFEALTAAALTAFAEKPADFTILEVGLGGRLDATNVVDQPLASIITRLSYDHRQHLGDTISQIAREKAGIMRAHVPCFTFPQPDGEVMATLRECAAAIEAPLMMGGLDWRVAPNDMGFRYTDAERDLDLPPPALTGAHQFWNAGLAIAALSVLPKPITAEAVVEGLRRVEWPARLQRIQQGKLADMLPKGWALWLDGGHNDSAGEVLAAQAAAWRKQDGNEPRPLLLIAGMLNTKNVQEFLTPLAPYVTAMRAIAIPNEDLSFPADIFASEALQAGIQQAVACPSLTAAIRSLAEAIHPPARILICGSLYLAGDALRQNER